MAGGHEKMQAVHVTAQGSTAEEGRRKKEEGRRREITYISNHTTVYMAAKGSTVQHVHPRGDTRRETLLGQSSNT